MAIRLQQNPNVASENQINQCSNWIMLLPATISKSLWMRVPFSKLIQERRRNLDKKTDDDDPVILDLPNKRHSHITQANIDTDISAFKLLGLARSLVKSHLDMNPEVMAISIMGFDGVTTERLAEALLAAVLAAYGKMPEYKSGKEKKARRLKLIKLFGCSREDGFKRTFVINEGNQLARNLSMLPPNKLRPADYLKQVRSLAKQNHWQLDFYGIDALKKHKAGAFLAVAQGSPSADAGMVRLQYRPKNSSRPKLVLVGKGICYDTGGTNLKPAKYMYGMHEDMQGSAVALGTLLALTQLKVDFAIDCWLALAMNHIGPKAYKPNDVVTAADGTHIEVVHTDAEGRMVLADTLIMATKQKAGLLIDYATLTGACVYSLGTAYSGVFTNKEAFLPNLIQAGKDSGERVWPFPMDEDYDEAIKSDIADVKQCALEGNADHILAARFLQRFVKNDVPWIHLDLASSNHKGGLAHIPTDTTGFGIRLTLDLLLDKKLLD